MFTTRNFMKGDCESGNEFIVLLLCTIFRRFGKIVRLQRSSRSLKKAGERGPLTNGRRLLRSPAFKKFENIMI